MNVNSLCSTQIIERRTAMAANFDDLEEFEELSLGEMLNFHRECDGLTLKEFETLTGICYSLTSRYERGKKKMSPCHEEIIISYISGGYDKAIQQLNQEKQKQNKIVLDGPKLKKEALRHYGL